MVQNFRHVLRMKDYRIPKRVILYELNATNLEPGRPRKNWNDISMLSRVR